jgi:hypothetical protein
MSQPNRICALHLPELERSKLNPDTQKYFAKCDEKLGFVPKVLRAFISKRPGIGSDVAASQPGGSDLPFR